MNFSLQQTDLDLVVDHFAKRHSRGLAPSCVWGIFDRSGMVRTGSTGRLPDGTTPGEHTAYRIASCTKSFAAAATLSLRDAGELSLDDPITRFLPAFSGVTLPTVDSPTPTLRMLLTMSAGFPTDNPWGDRQESMTNEELDGLLSNGLSFDSIPGTTFAYSNLGYALLGRAIEQISGHSFIELVTERFLLPLGLTETGFDSSVAASGGVAIGTDRIEHKWESLPFSGPGAFSPIGGLFSTVSDLGRWAGWLAEAFDPSAAEQAGSPLSRASRRELQQLQRYAPGTLNYPGGYGLGLHIDHYPNEEIVTSHSGGYPGFSAHMRWSQTSGIGMIAFENATGSRVANAVVEVLDAILESRRPQTTPRVWPETRAAQASITALLGNWSDAQAARIFSENIAMDEPSDRRRRSIDDAVSSIGGLDATASTRPQDETSASPSQLTWFVPGQAGRLQVEIQLTPEKPPRVQSLQVTVDR